MVDADRRKVLGLGGAALMVGLAGCIIFEDTTGVPVRDEVDAGEEESVDTGENEEAIEAETNAFGPSE